MCDRTFWMEEIKPTLASILIQLKFNFLVDGSPCINFALLTQTLNKEITLVGAACEDLCHLCWKSIWLVVFLR